MTTTGHEIPQAPHPASRPDHSRQQYQPPTLTGKKALQEVTLFSFTCKPGDPNCNVGHP